MSSPNSSEAIWPTAPGKERRVAPDEVVVWRITLTDVRVDDVGLLSADELERADRFKFPQVRLAYLQGRLFLRKMLGALLDRPAADLHFSLEGNGKPTLEDSAIAFNLSHSGGEALLAVSTAKPVGVDIEVIREKR